jgi:hypothetical protein
MRACEGLDYGHSCSVLKASIWVRMTAFTLALAGVPNAWRNWLPHRRDRTRDYPGRVGDRRRFLEVNPPDPETQSTANLLSAAMGQD